MYNGNYPNDFEENQGQTESGGQQAQPADSANTSGTQQSAFGGQDSQNGSQSAAYEQTNGAGGQYSQSASGSQGGAGAQSGSSAQSGSGVQGGSGTPGASNGQDGYQYHNYYNDRYRSQNGYQNDRRDQNGYQGYQNRDNGYQRADGYDRGRTGNGGYGQGNGGYGQGNGGYGNYGGSDDGFYGRNDHGMRDRKKKTSKGKVALAVALVAVFVVFCAGISWMAVNTLQEQIASIAETPTEPEEAQTPEEAAPEPVKEIPEEDQIASAGSSQADGKVTAVVTDVTDVVERVMPASVSITNNFTQQVQDFWGQTYSQDETSSGSGIIIGQNDTELLIVTNNHVVDGTNELRVQFIDGEVVEAQVKGTDSAVDLAVIAVKLADIQAETKAAICIAEMGDSDSLRIGEPAIAIGNALGYGQSVTTGVISALNRSPEVSETGTSTALIQTDAAINPGNSGGALLNIKGQVIGINSSKIGGSVVEGMGYAVPISTAKPIIEELMTHETKSRVSDQDRGYLGISCINVTSDLSENFNMPEGIFVAQVYEGTGADRAGLVRGDIITEFDGTEVKNQEELTRLMGYYKAGETVEITIMQGSPTGYQAKTVSITLSSYEEMNESTQKSQEAAQEESRRQIWP